MFRDQAVPTTWRGIGVRSGRACAGVGIGLVSECLRGPSHGGPLRGDEKRGKPTGNNNLPAVDRGWRVGLVTNIANRCSRGSNDPSPCGTASSTGVELCTLRLQPVWLRYTYATGMRCPPQRRKETSKAHGNTELESRNGRSNRPLLRISPIDTYEAPAVVEHRANRAISGPFSRRVRGRTGPHLRWIRVPFGDGLCQVSFPTSTKSSTSP